MKLNFGDKCTTANKFADYQQIYDDMNEYVLSRATQYHYGESQWNQNEQDWNDAVALERADYFKL